MQWSFTNFIRMKMTIEIKASIPGIKGKFKKESSSPLTVPSCKHVYLKGSEKDTVIITHGKIDGSVTCNKIDGARL